MKSKTKDEKIKYLQKELRRYKKISQKDFLTGLWNRRKLDKDLEKYLEMKDRNGTNFVVAMIDLDNFKSINDTKGHSAGDKVLKETAKALKSVIRLYDNAYRLAGDEFVLIFKDALDVEEIIVRIDKALKKKDIKASIGCGIIKENILEYIDEMMYENKRQNR